MVPCSTFWATIMPMRFFGLVPVFVDIHPRTLNFDVEDAKRKLTKNTKAMFPVHYLGMPCDMDHICDFAQQKGLIVLEDACHAHGAEYRGRRCGSLGDLAAFSFQSSKNLCSGEGGFISTNNERLGDLARAMSHVGRLKKAAWYEHAVPGGNFRLSALQSALLLAQLKRLERQTTRRDANGRYLAAKLSLIEGLHPQKLGSATTRCSHHLFMFRLDPAVFPVPRDKFVQALRAEGIPCSGGYGVPLNRQPVFLQKHFAPFSPAARKRRDVNYARQRFPVAERLCAESVWFTQSMLLGSRKDMNDIVRAVRKVRDHAGELR